MLNKLRYFVFISLCILLFNSCSNFSLNKFNEGIINYDITYPNAGKNESIISLMPSTMSFKFKNDRTCGELTGNMGIFGTSIISDYDKKSVYQTLKVLGKKFASVFDEKSINEQMAAEPKMEVKFSDDKKIIAGFKCKKATIVFEDKTLPTFDVYYTDEIKIKHANWFSPFKEIDGVLMEYRIKRYNVEMQMTAKSVVEQEIEDEDFQITSDYKIISRQEMDEMFMSFN